VVLPASTFDAAVERDPGGVEADEAFGRDTRRELGLGRNAELAHHEDVKRSASRGGNDRGHGHPSTRHTEDERVLEFEVDEPLPCLTPVV
jgi:hypothetical protein